MNMTNTINGIHYDESGEGFPVVMIHGLGGGGDTFDSILPAFSGFRIIRPELPGSGQSALPEQPPTIELFADAVLSLLKTLGVERAHLVGHSLGSMVCQCLAEKAPALVESLVLFGALTEPPEAGRSGLKDRAGVARESGMAGIADVVAKNTLSQQTHANIPSAAVFVKNSLNRQNPEGYALTCEALSVARASAWDKINAPTLLLTGDSDPTAPPVMAEILNQNIPHAKLVILDGCGHWATIEKPEDCIKHISDFLADHS